MMKTQHRIKISSLLLLLLLVLSSVVVADEFSPKFVDVPLLDYPLHGRTVNTPILTFEWSGSYTIQAYKIVVKDPNGAKVWKKKYTYAEACTVSKCKSEPWVEDDLLFDNGVEYTWKVVAKNTHGKASSVKSIFNVDAPGAPALYEPFHNNEIPQANYTLFLWAQHARATEYRLIVKQRSGGNYTLKTEWMPVSPLCFETCNYNLNEVLPVGDYRWKVVAREAPFSNKSNRKWDFKVVAPPS